MRITLSKMWIFVLPVILSLHMYKVHLFIFILLSIHELAHITCAHYLGYKSVEVCIYPMGLSARIKDLEYQRSISEIWITISGLSVHIIMYFVLHVFVLWGWISQSFMLYLNDFNMQILCFNLIPIFPLDGGRIIRNLLELIVPYKKAKILSLLFSFILLGYLVVKGLLLNISGIVVCCFFIFQLGIAVYQYNNTNLEFYLYRIMHKFTGKIKLHHKKDIYKNRYNMIVDNNEIKNETDYLSKYF